jgi:hypothetical protein
MRTMEYVDPSVPTKPKLCDWTIASTNGGNLRPNREQDQRKDMLMRTIVRI